MPFTHTELRSLAVARGQTVVLAVVRGRECGLLVDAPDASLNDLAQSLGTDDWERWSFGQLEAFGSDGVRLDDADCRRKWNEIEPVEFREVGEGETSVAPAGKVTATTLATTTTPTKPKPTVWPPKLTLRKHTDDNAWWIHGGRSGATEHGPYDLRKEAEEDRDGLTKFYASLKEHER